MRRPSTKINEYSLGKPRNLIFPASAFKPVPPLTPGCLLMSSPIEVTGSRLISASCITDTLAGAFFKLLPEPLAVTTISSSSVSASADCVAVSAKAGIANAAKMATDKVE